MIRKTKPSSGPSHFVSHPTCKPSTIIIWLKKIFKGGERENIQKYVFEVIDPANVGALVMITVTYSTPVTLNKVILGEPRESDVLLGREHE